MESRPLGPGAPHVSALAFGGMPLSLPGRPDEEQSIRVLHAALDAGVTLLDTADVYCLDDADLGHNERLFAKALASWSGDRDSIVVATKGGLVRPDEKTWLPRGRPEHLRAACERSLSALGLERIDLYQFHTVDPDVPFAESVGALAELRAEGKIRWVGLSNVALEQVREARKLVPIHSVQNRLNPFFRAPIGKRFMRSSFVQKLDDMQIAFLAYSPVGGGRLHKKLPQHPVVKPIAERLGVSAHAVALAWVRAQAPNVIPIVAARTVEHVLDSVQSFPAELTRSELQAIDRATFDLE